MAKEEKITVKNTEDANGALREIGRLKDQRGLIEVRERNVIRDAEMRLADETAPLDEQITAREKALQSWAKKNKEELFKDARSLELCCGWVGYRWTKWKMKFLVIAETVVNRIEAQKRHDLLHVKKSPNLEKLLDYENDFLEPFGLRKTRQEKFFYDCKPEVK